MDGGSGFSDHRLKAMTSDPFEPLDLSTRPGGDSPVGRDLSSPLDLTVKRVDLANQQFANNRPGMQYPGMVSSQNAMYFNGMISRGVTSNPVPSSVVYSRDTSSVRPSPIGSTVGHLRDGVPVRSNSIGSGMVYSRDTASAPPGHFYSHPGMMYHTTQTGISCMATAIPATMRPTGGRSSQLRPANPVNYQSPNRSSIPMSNSLRSTAVMATPVSANVFTSSVAEHNKHYPPVTSQMCRTPTPQQKVGYFHHASFKRPGHPEGPVELARALQGKLNYCNSPVRGSRKKSNHHGHRTPPVLYRTPPPLLQMPDFQQDSFPVTVVANKSLSEADFSQPVNPSQESLIDANSTLPSSASQSLADMWTSGRENLSISCDGSTTLKPTVKSDSGSSLPGNVGPGTVDHNKQMITLQSKQSEPTNCVTQTQQPAFTVSSEGDNPPQTLQFSGAAYMPKTTITTVTTSVVAMGNSSSASPFSSVPITLPVVTTSDVRVANPHGTNHPTCIKSRSRVEYRPILHGGRNSPRCQQQGPPKPPGSLPIDKHSSPNHTAPVCQPLHMNGFQKIFASFLEQRSSTDQEQIGKPDLVPASNAPITLASNVHKTVSHNPPSLQVPNDSSYISSGSSGNAVSSLPLSSNDHCTNKKPAQQVAPVDHTGRAIQTSYQQATANATNGNRPSIALPDRQKACSKHVPVANVSPIRHVDGMEGKRNAMGGSLPGSKGCGSSAGGDDGRTPGGPSRILQQYLETDKPLITTPQARKTQDNSDEASNADKQSVPAFNCKKPVVVKSEKIGKTKRPMAGDKGTGRRIKCGCENTSRPGEIQVATSCDIISSSTSAPTKKKKPRKSKSVKEDDVMVETVAKDAAPKRRKVYRKRGEPVGDDPEKNQNVVRRKRRKKTPEMKPNPGPISVKQVLEFERIKVEDHPRRRLRANITSRELRDKRSLKSLRTGVRRARLLPAYNRNAAYEEELLKEEERRLYLRIQRKSRRLSDRDKDGSDIDDDDYTDSEITPPYHNRTCQRRYSMDNRDLPELPGVSNIDNDDIAKATAQVGSQDGNESEEMDTPNLPEIQVKVSPRRVKRNKYILKRRTSPRKLRDEIGSSEIDNIADCEGVVRRGKSPGGKGNFKRKIFADRGNVADLDLNAPNECVHHKRSFRKRRLHDGDLAPVDYPLEITADRFPPRKRRTLKRSLIKVSRKRNLADETVADEGVIEGTDFTRDNIEGDVNVTTTVPAKKPRTRRKKLYYSLASTKKKYRKFREFHSSRPSLCSEEFDVNGLGVTPDGMETALVYSGEDKVPVYPSSGSSHHLTLGNRQMTVCRETGETLLHKAARLGYQDMVSHCIEQREMDVNIRDNAGYTPLHEACVKGHLKIAKYLIRRGADFNAGALEGTRPLHDAVDNNRVELVRLLLSHRVDPKIATYSGRTALKLARTEGMKNVVHGHFADLNGPDQCEVPWLFDGTLTWPAPPKTEKEKNDTRSGSGYNIFYDGAPDGSDDSLHIEFEFMEEPPIQAYHLCLDNRKGPRNYYLLDDVVGRVGMTEHEFLLSSDDICLNATFAAQLEKPLRAQQLNSGELRDALCARTAGVANQVIHFVEADDHVKRLLKIEIVKTDLNSDSDLLQSESTRGQVYEQQSNTTNGVKQESLCNGIDSISPDRSIERPSLSETTDDTSHNISRVCHQTENQKPSNHENILVSDETGTWNFKYCSNFPENSKANFINRSISENDDFSKACSRDRLRLTGENSAAYIKSAPCGETIKDVPVLEAVTDSKLNVRTKPENQHAQCSQCPPLVDGFQRDVHGSELSKETTTNSEADPPETLDMIVDPTRSPKSPPLCSPIQQDCGNEADRYEPEMPKLTPYA